MKDSDIEWIGQIPEDWRIVKIKILTTKVGSGKTPKGGAEIYQEEGVLFIRSQNVYDEGLSLLEPTYISDEIDEDMANTRVQDKDVLLNITGGSIGRCCIYDGKFGRANVNQHVSIIRVIPGKVLPDLMHYFWNSYMGKTSIDLYQTGGNREGMSADAIKNTFIPFPPLSEQSEIAAYLDKKSSQINTVIAQKEQFITEMEKYKQSFIYEYVTGKREVN
jgi:type I restriction enzyme S subunit